LSPCHSHPRLDDLAAEDASPDLERHAQANFVAGARDVFGREDLLAELSEFAGELRQKMYIYIYIFLVVIF
jgi:hypothetical protein